MTSSMRRRVTSIHDSGSTGNTESLAACSVRVNSDAARSTGAQIKHQRAKASNKLNERVGRSDDNENYPSVVELACAYRLRPFPPSDGPEGATNTRKTSWASRMATQVAGNTGMGVRANVLRCLRHKLTSAACIQRGATLNHGEFICRRAGMGTLAQITASPELPTLYWRIGQLILFSQENGRGGHVIKRLALRELPDVNGSVSYPTCTLPRAKRGLSAHSNRLFHG